MSDVTLKAVLMGEDRSLSKTMNKAGDSVEKVGTKAKGAGSVMKGALGADVVMQATDAIIDFGRDSIEAFRGAEVSQNQLQDAYKRFPAINSVNIASLREYNEELQKKGFADADDIASGQAVLARYKLTGQQLKSMTPLLVDYANRTGKSIPDAAKAMGKALGGSSKLAKELGFSFKDAKDPAKNFDQIMAGLQGTVGGYSAKLPEAERNSKALGYSFGDLQESLGEKLMPIMSKAAEVGLKVVDWISQNASVLGPLAAGIGIVAGAFLALNAVMAINPFMLIVIAIGALVGGLIWAYQNVSWFRDGVNAAFSAIGAAGRWLWNNALAPALRGIVTGFAWVIDGLANMLDALGNIPGFGWAKSAAAGLRGLANSARGAADSIKDIPDPKVEVGPAKKRVDDLKSKINSIKGKIVEAKARGDDKAVVNLKRKLDSLKKEYKIAMRVYKTGISTITARPSGGGSIHVRAVALGGSVKSGLPYWVGENGPELFWPGANGHINNRFQLQNATRNGAAAATTGGVVLNFEQNVTVSPGADLKEFGKVTEKALMQVQAARNGRPFAIKTR